MSRNIDFTTYPMAYPPIMEWVRANGLDPRHLPFDQEAVVEDGSISVTEFVFTEFGAKQIAGDRPITKRVTVPLISAPENHGL